MDSIRKMSLIELQKQLAGELEKIMQDMLFQQPDSTELVKMKAYRQALPIPQRIEKTYPYNSDDLPDEESGYKMGYPFPWALIKLDRGTVEGIGGNQKISVLIIFGIFNDSLENTGHEAITIMIERVMERFSKDPLLAGQMTAAPVDENHMFNWSLQDEDTYPYFYGALEMAFWMPGFQREDRYGFA